MQLRLPLAGAAGAALALAAALPGSAPALAASQGRQISSSTYAVTPLVSDQPGGAPTVDSNLINPWGLAASPTSPWWISDNNAGVSTLYDGAGTTQPLVVNIPAPGGGAGAPTGVVFNGGNGFNVTAHSTTAPARFIFSAEDGGISGWAQSVDPTNAVLAHDFSGGMSVFKGLAIGSSGGSDFLYAADFHNGNVVKMDSSFTPVSTFTDASVPAGFAPFNVVNIGGTLYVSFAMQNAEKHDDVAGPGNGYVDAFDTSGTLLRRVASAGPLDSPWGMALAPSTFGPLAGTLLVGNFGDGRINAFDPATGAFKGAMLGTDHQPVTIPELWGLAFGNGAKAGPTSTLFFTAGTGGEQHGTFGSITVQAPITQGYWLAAGDGGIFPYGNATGFGSHGGSPLNSPIVAVAVTEDGGGYWLAAADGGIFPYGDARGFGSLGGSPLNKPIVGMAATPDGGGYWLVASDGGIFPYGDAEGFGSHGGSPLNKPIVGMAATPDGGGYWLVASDGGIFPYGDAAGLGSHGGAPLNSPIVGMATTPDGGGYWLVAGDGGIFPYGDARGLGSHGGSPLNKPIVAMAATADGGGYWLVASDGGIFPYGDADGAGSHGGSPLNSPIVGLAARG